MKLIIFEKLIEDDTRHDEKQRYFYELGEKGQGNLLLLTKDGRLEVGFIYYSYCSGLSVQLRDNGDVLLLSHFIGYFTSLEIGTTEG